METKVYLNLTNGIDFLEDPDFKEDYKFVRIQSSACERHCWDKILMELDYNFLMDVALGYNVIVYDTSNKRIVSRALYQGLAFVNYALNRIWLNKIVKPDVKGMDCSEYFNEEFLKIKDKSLKKIKYVKKFLNTDKLHLGYIGKQTTHDGDYTYYKNLLISSLENKN